MKAFRQAVENHQQEKVDAFRAIILNTLINQDQKDDEISIFLNLTERLTPLHIKMLTILADPEAALALNQEAKAKIDNVYMGGLSTLFAALLPGYSTSSINVIFNDLYSMGLHNTPQLAVSMSKHGIVSKRITEFGQEYIMFITLPKEVSAQRA